MAQQPTVRRLTDDSGGLSVVVWTCTHPDPNRGAERAVSHAKRLARATAVGSDRSAWYVATDANNMVLYSSRWDDEILRLEAQFPIQKDHPYHGTRP